MPDSLIESETRPRTHETARAHFESSPLRELRRHRQLHVRDAAARPLPRPPAVLLRVLQASHMGRMATRIAGAATEEVGRLSWRPLLSSGLFWFPLLPPGKGTALDYSGRDRVPAT